jgi:tetratricopeptide (TPR) repeat protein
VVFFLNYKKDQKNEEAQNEIFQAQYYYENDSLDFALNGDGRNLGFVQIIDIYGGTEVANLANFYAGASYLKQRQYNEAVAYLSDFSTEEEIVMARAQKLLGDAYMELGNFSDAASNYMKAASTVDDQFFFPSYLLSASLAFERGGDLNAAIEACDKVINDYNDDADNELQLMQMEARKQKSTIGSPCRSLMHEQKH